MYKSTCSHIYHIIFCTFFSVFLMACSHEKTDKELLEQDKKVLAESLNTSQAYSYKFGKICIRASIETDTISPQFKSFKTRLDKTFNKVFEYDTANLSVMDYISIYKDYRDMNAFIKETDEDIFPTVTEALSVAYGDSAGVHVTHLQGEEKQKVQNMEHAVLSAVFMVAKSVGDNISLYECSKTNPYLLPDNEIKALLLFYRGFLFYKHGLYYLSEDDITQNINWLNKTPDADFTFTKAIFKWNTLSNEKAHIGLHSLNHVFRGFDRLMMEREVDEKRAVEDFEVFLEDSKKLGLDNELIWAIETYVFLKHEESEKAIGSLTKLRSSPILSSKDKTTIDESIAYLKDRKKGSTLNGVYDKYFLSRIAVSYMMHILAQVNWEALLESQGVPHTKEFFNTIRTFQKFLDGFGKYTTKDITTEATQQVSTQTKSWWQKAKDKVGK